MSKSEGVADEAKIDGDDAANVNGAAPISPEAAAEAKLAALIERKLALDTASGELDKEMEALGLTGKKLRSIMTARKNQQRAELTLRSLMGAGILGQAAT